MDLRSSNSLHSILASVLSKKIKQYCLKFHAAWEFFLKQRMTYGTFMTCFFVQVSLE